jgi:hypothetical protein
VFTDYTAGIAFAMADSVEEARRLIAESDAKCYAERIAKELSKEPEVFDGPHGDYIWGGG